MPEKLTSTLTESGYAAAMRWPALDANVWRYIEFEEMCTRLFPGVFYVGWPQFAAVGDGTTDDSAAVQAAIDAAEAHMAIYNSATVRLMARHRINTQINVESNNIRIEGHAAGENGGTTLLGYNSIGADNAVIAFYSAATNLQANSIYNVRIADGETLTNTIHGIIWGSEKGSIHRVVVDGMSGDGLRFQGRDGNGIQEAKVIDCTFGNNGGDGINLQPFTADCHVVACVCNNNTGAGIRIGNGAAGTMIDQVHCYTNTAGGVLFTGGGKACQITSSKMETNIAGGIVLDGATGGNSKIIISGVRFKDTGRATDSTSQINNIGSNAYDNVTVTGCEFSYEGVTSAPPLYHINIGTGQGWVIGNNTYVVPSPLNGFLGNVNTQQSESGGRQVLDGTGYNAGSPNATGIWSGGLGSNLAPLRHVWDYTNKRLYIHHNGVFYRTDGAQILSEYARNHWSLEDLTDSVGALTLTNNNSVTFPAGKVGNGAIFNGTNQSLTIAAGDVFPSGNVSWTAALWLYINTKNNPSPIISQNNTTGNQRAVHLQYLGGGTDRLQLAISADGATTTTQSAVAFGSPPADEWHLVFIWHNAEDDQIGIAVDDGAANVTAHTGGVFDSTAAFAIGSNSTQTTFSDISVDEVTIYDKVLDAGERAWLFNNDTGRTWAEVLAG